MNYFVRYKFSHSINHYMSESGLIEEEMSHIISTDDEFDDIFEVQHVLKTLHSLPNTYFDIIALNKL